MVEKLALWLSEAAEKFKQKVQLQILDKKTFKALKKFTLKNHRRIVRYGKLGRPNLKAINIYMQHEESPVERIKSVKKKHEEGALIEKTRKLLLDTCYNPAKSLLDKEQEKFETMRREYNKEVATSPATAEAGRKKKQNLKGMRINMINQEKTVEGLERIAYGIEENKAKVELEQENYKPPVNTAAGIKLKLKAEKAAEEKRIKREKEAEEKRLKKEEQKAKEKAKKEAEKAKQKAAKQKIKDKAKEKEQKLKNQLKEAKKKKPGTNKKAAPKKSAAKEVKK